MPRPGGGDIEDAGQSYGEIVLLHEFSAWSEQFLGNVTAVGEVKVARDMQVLVWFGSIDVTQPCG